MNKRAILQHLARSASAAAATIALAAPVAAIAQGVVHQFNIPAQDLGAALRAFGQASGQQIMFSGADVQGKASTPLVGGYSAEEGLRRLLDGSGLQFARSRTGVLVVGNAPGEAEAGGAAADSGSAEAVTEGYAEILVVGSRSLNADIRRSEDGVQPYVVLDQEDIRRSGATSVDDFLRTRLPQNTQRNSADQAPQSQLANVSSGANNGRIDLRGLGTNQTLILIDGRRVPAVGTGDLGQPNITGVPLSAIERIEVLPSTAGAIYGGSAIGGVVNIVLRRDYRGIEAQLEYGDTFDGATGDFRASIAGGFRLGSTRISFSGSRLRAADLAHIDRPEFTQRSRALTLANNPAALATVLPLGATPNICASIATGTGRCNGVPLVLDNGTPLGSSLTSVPLGYRGPVAAGDGGAALLANAGRFNLQDPDDGDILVRGSHRDAFNLNIRQPVVDAVELFADVNWNRTRGSLEYADPVTTLLQPNDPNNPFQQPILVLLSAGTLGSSVQTEAENLSVTGGAIVRLPHGWSLSLEQVWGQSRNRSEVESRATNAAVQALAAGIATSDVNAVSVPDLLPAATVTVRTNGPIDTTLLDSSARLGGNLFDLPGGPLAVSMLAERRVEEIGEFYQGTFPRGGAATFTFSPRRRQRVESLYSEARLPLVSAANARPLLQLLELQGSVRYDRYTTRSVTAVFSGVGPDSPRPDLNYVTNRVESVDYLAGARYAPFDGVTLRGSYATGFLPPSINQLVSGAPFLGNASSLAVVDPRRGGERLIGDATGRISQTSGGRPDLEPERSRSLSFGLILQPPQVPGLRFSADFTRIRKQDEIQTLAFQDLINNEDSFPGRVTRGPNRAGDPAGYAGPIIALDRTLINVARSKVEAWDFQLDYRLETARFGSFHPFVIATHQTLFARKLLDGSPFNSTLDFANGPLRWRGNLGLDWTLGGLAVSWNMQYYHSYRACNSTDLAATCTANVLNQGAERIRSQVYHDLYIRYALDGPAILAGTEISVGINNLFDSSPPIIAQPTSRFGTYSAYGDPRLRRFVISVRRRFGN